MRRSLAVVAVLATALVAGCGGGEDSEDSDQAEITAVLEKLFDAQQAGDAETACEEVYVIQEPPRPGSDAEGESRESEAEVGEAGLRECEAAFQKAVALRRREVSDLQTEIGSIELDGDQARATVHTELRRSDGSELSQDVPYDLVHTADGWRVRIAEEG